MSSESELFVSRTEQGTQGGMIQSAGVGLWTRESIYMPAVEFRGYNEALPGSAERLLTLFEEQARHRMAVEMCQVQDERSKIQNEHETSKRLIETDQSDKTRAAAVGLIALLFFIALAVFFAFMGMEAAAIAAILVPAIQCIGDWIGKLTKDKKTHNDDPGSR